VTAREINPDIYVIARQNHTSNSRLFLAYGADFTVVSRALVAEHCIALVRTPLLGRFITRLKGGDDSLGEKALSLIEERIGAQKITTWNVTVAPASAAAVYAALALRSLPTEALLRDSSSRERLLDAVLLLVVRTSKEIVLPPLDLTLESGDQLLFAGTDESRRLQRTVLINSNVLDYVSLGRDIPGGWLWEHFARRQVERNLT
jgi:voltage-gated potassium channel